MSEALKSFTTRSTYESDIHTQGCEDRDSLLDSNTVILSKDDAVQRGVDSGARFASYAGSTNATKPR